MAVFLVLSVLISPGCNKKEADSSKETSTTETGAPSSSTVRSGTTGSSDTSTESTTAATRTKNPLDGKYYYDEKVVNEEGTVKEIIPTGNTANLSKQLKGYFDAEAETLRKKILNTKNTEEYYKITGNKYYVSSRNGDDSNSGLSPAEALKTAEGIRGLNLKPGDAVLFERGSVFRLDSSILTVNGVTYGSYGTGEKPKIYASPVNLATVTWVPSNKKNVWKIDYIYPDCGSMIFNHGKEVGYKKTNLRSLEKNTEFFQDKSSNTLYVYCDKGNPAKVYESIEIALEMPIINIPSNGKNIVIDNLCMKYSGQFAVKGTWNIKNVTVTNCEIGYIGGGTLNTSSRYGNAIQFWTGSENIVCEYNWIYQTWDTAISWQGYGGSDFYYKNVSFCNNLLEFNNADYEYWDPGSSVENFSMCNNIMRFTALGWGTRENDGGYRGIEGNFVGNTKDMAVKKLYVKDNIIDCPGRMIVNWQIDPADINTELFVSGNKIYVNSSYRTGTEIVRGFKHDESEANGKHAKNADEFIAALKKFDPTAVLKWN